MSVIVAGGNELGQGQLIERAAPIPPRPYDDAAGATRISYGASLHTYFTNALRSLLPTLG
jgi:hypothetical protein